MISQILTRRWESKSMAFFYDFQDLELTFLTSALSATPPFPRWSPRLRLAAVLGPACLVSLMTSSYILMKLTTLLFGFVFFGDPVIRRGIIYLNRRFPKWQKIIELQKYDFKLSKYAKIKNANMTQFFTQRHPNQCSIGRDSSAHWRGQCIPLAASSNLTGQSTLATSLFAQRRVDIGCYRRGNQASRISQASWW
jgi:hypothetical protein